MIQILFSPLGLLRLLGSCAIAASTVGCTWSAPQVESITRLIGGIGAFGSSDTIEEPAVWLASVGNRGAVVIPYSVDESFVFANEDGDAIVFDGWTVRGITGFGLVSPISIAGKSGVRRFVVAGEQSTTMCRPWTRTGLMFSQSCENGEGQIMVNEQGDIEKITMAIGSTIGNVTLRVAK